MDLTVLSRRPRVSILCPAQRTHRKSSARYPTDSGVCCLDWHSKEPAMLAVGLYDGTVRRRSSCLGRDKLSTGIRDAPSVCRSAATLS